VKTDQFNTGTSSKPQYDGKTISISEMGNFDTGTETVKTNLQHIPLAQSNRLSDNAGKSQGVQQTQNLTTDFGTTDLLISRNPC